MDKQKTTSKNAQTKTEPSKTAPPQLPPLGDRSGTAYASLVEQTRNAVKSAGFSRIGFGLSGGIDSALVACIAVDALAADEISPDQVQGIIMPSVWTPSASVNDARLIARNLGIDCQTIDIMDSYAAISRGLLPLFDAGIDGHVGGNIQARIRGLMLMAVSNQQHRFVLCPSNLSEISVGYTTLYGDMVGSFAPIAALYKTWVYELAHYRNELAVQQGLVAPIPPSVLEKAPSAELIEGQKDEDDLGPYGMLDAYLYVYHSLQTKNTPEKVREILEKEGFESPYVDTIMRRIDRSSFKCLQACPRSTLSID